MSGARAGAAALEAALREQQLLSGRAAPLPPPDPGRPWFVGVLLGFSGWLAGLLTLGFIALAFRPSETASLIALGLVLLGVAWGLYRAGEGAFLEQLALALSVAGHAAVGAGAAEGLQSAAGTAAAVALALAGWGLIVPNALGRLLSTVAGCAAAALAARLLLDGGRGRREGIPLLPALAGWAAVWGPVALLARHLVSTEARWMGAGRQRLLRPVSTGLLVALALATPFSHPVQSLELWGPEAAHRTSWVALWPLLSIGAAVVVLWLGHRLRSRPLMGTAIAAALLHVFHFYLALGVPLRVKAALMVAVGALLLAARAALGRGDRGREAP